MSASVSVSSEDWYSEFREKAIRYHKIGCWVAITLNPIWFVSDFYITPEHWMTFLWIRLTVALVTLLGLLGYRTLNLSPQQLILIPFLGITLQNAYMYSVMDVAQVQQHTFAYIAIFLGAGMLILWEWYYSVFVVVATLIVNLILYLLYSPLTPDQMMINGGLLTATAAVISIALIQIRYNLTKREIQARLALQESNAQLQKQKEVIEEKNASITASINYAQTIQEAILPTRKEMDQHLNHFVFFRPRDVVSGDFYWFSHQDFNDQAHNLIAAVDCTGHGVPGGFMSMIGNELLNKIVLEYEMVQPQQILNELDKGVIKALQQEKKGGESKDGMDLALCTIVPDERKIYFAGANNPLYVVSGSGFSVQGSEVKTFQPQTSNPKSEIQNSKLFELLPDKQPIGYQERQKPPFTLNEANYQKGDMIYLFSDGYPDQFGGPKGKKFRYKGLRQLLLDIHEKPVEEQEKVVAQTFDDWKGDEPQIDDVLLIGVRLG